ncbi:DUF5712 family protein [Zunongwangia profunda]|uniref:DUF5712 family protein n=1 Tax=Zunongwangia profunda TaxID=398743 RepID=UPI00248F22EB|nr:DUF5712 family protein [Zunongwangia profunda]|tara:strand:+ start:3120 stop:4013 length:894 start_codon:yes stop_codon:yes gene_type:complete
MPISKPHSSLGAKNTGSCSSLAQYLDKENQELEKMIKTSNTISRISLYEKRKQHFFNATSDQISLVSVIDKIDNNRKKLAKKDAKYYAPTISFSQKELEHLSEIVSGRKVNNIWDFSNEEYLKFNELIRNYGRQVMDEYAANFNRQNKGLKNGKDLVYFGKIEHFRKFKGNDKEVKDGLYKSGDYKPGLTTHIHLIISRKDKTQKMKLSPLSNERSKDRIIGKNKYHVGFDRLKWIKNNEKAFDNLFKYQRKELEKFEVQNILKNGSPKEKVQIKMRLEKLPEAIEINKTRNFSMKR